MVTRRQTGTAVSTASAAEIAPTAEIHWDDLRVVSTVNRSGSFARAAGDLGLNETTVARRLTRIEAALGFRLFDSVDGRRWPTEGCRRILQSLAVMERAAAEVSAVKSRPGSLNRRLRLSTIDTIAEHIVAPAVTRLLATEPGLTLEIETGDQNVDMSRWEADLAIRLGRPNRGAFNMRRIGEIDYYLVTPKTASRRGTARRGPPASPSLPLPRITYPDTLVSRPEMAALARARPASPVRIQTSSYGVIHRLLDAGAGVSILPGFIVRQLPPNHAFELDRLDARREVWLLTQSHARDDALARRLADWCASLFQPLPAVTRLSMGGRATPAPEAPRRPGGSV